MTSRWIRTISVFVLPVAVTVAQEPQSIEDHVAGMTAHRGFLELHADDEKGRMLAAVTAFDQEFLYSVAVASGLGSNPVGLDRGSLGPQHVVEFRRRGPKVLLVAKNLKFRARSEDPRERRAVAESFAESVLAGFDIVAETDGRVLIDATDFLIRDAAGATSKVRRAGQGSYRLDAKRSAFEFAKSFPDNTEVEVMLTFHSDRPGNLVRETAATGDAFSLRQRHSFVRLPDGYAPRRTDPRVGYSGVSFRDYAMPIGAPMDVRWIARHRLVKRDPSAKVSEPVEPIVYYLDSGTPEPVRTALKEGARWWAEAFEAAGFANAFRVVDLPDGVDALDVRYNVIHWVHRATRGWSYGSSVRDPRTGEILKGNVLLGSLRVRQDHLIFSGLEGAGGDGCCAAAAPDANHLLPADDGRAQELALARIRQLSAHEVGHTLGLSHNFAASTYTERASVMDYPAPWVKARDGRLDFSDAYAVGIGDYDKWAIRWGYAQFAAGADESAELDAIIREGLAKGYVFLTDQDARSSRTFHPRANLWDNGADPVAELLNTIEVRRIGLAQFGLGNLRSGAPLADLEHTLVPLYLHHRFQLDAALKVIGGVDFRYAVKGDGQPGPRSIPFEKQREALDAVLGLLDPETLELPRRVLDLIPPAPPGQSSAAERFPRRTGGTLDPVAVGLTAAEPVVAGLLDPARAARLAGQSEGQDFAHVVQRLVARTWVLERPVSRTAQAIQRAVQTLVADRLMALGTSADARPEVRAVAIDELADLLTKVGTAPVADWGVAYVAHIRDHIRRIRHYLQNPQQPTSRTPSIDVPPGSPIGDGKK